METMSEQKFYEEEIAPGAEELIRDYDVNKACGAMCDAWTETSDEAETVEGSDETVGAFERTWLSNPYCIEGQGYGDPKVDKEFESLESQCEADYKDKCEKDGVECDFDSDDFQEFEHRWWEDDMTVYAYANIGFDRNYNGTYTLIGKLSRSFDYNYGQNPEDELVVAMELTPDQFTSENAERFLNSCKEEFENYSFTDGYKKVDVPAV